MVTTEKDISKIALLYICSLFVKVIEDINERVFTKTSISNEHRSTYDLQFDTSLGIENFVCFVGSIYL
jgi:hypothetical protein